jgi:AcrR family transcriptional regulator
MSNEVRDRSREILRGELADAAATFCVEHGFDRTTAAEIARGIGISRATFFRYFASKEEAVVSAARGAATRAGSFALSVSRAADAAAPGTPAWTVLRTAAEPMTTTADTRGDQLRARIRMITEVPALMAHLASQQTDDRASVTEVLRTRLPNGPTADAHAATLAAAGVAAVDLAWQEWAHTPGSELRPLLDSYFAAFGGLAVPTLG